MRVHELAKDLEITSAEVLAIAKANNIDVANAAAGLSHSDEASIRLMHVFGVDANEPVIETKAEQRDDAHATSQSPAQSVANEPPTVTDLPSTKSQTSASPPRRRKSRPSQSVGTQTTQRPYHERWPFIPVSTRRPPMKRSHTTDEIAIASDVEKSMTLDKSGKPAVCIIGDAEQDVSLEVYASTDPETGFFAIEAIDVPAQSVVTLPEVFTAVRYVRFVAKKPIALVVNCLG